MDIDVLVVGAGPTGLMMANQLHRRGVRTMIIDRHAGPTLQTRALAVQARTLEIYSHLGIVDRAVEMGKRATGANLWARGRRTARIPVGDIGQGLSPYPFLLVLGQDDNEMLLWEWRTGRALDRRQCAGMYHLAFTPDGRRAVTGHPDHQVRVWRLPEAPAEE